jgi:hypothetical protein
MAESCKGVTAAGSSCRRPPTRGRGYCLSHDPERKDELATITSMGGKARHDPAVLSLKDEIRDLTYDVRRGRVSPGAGNVMLTGYRLLREITADEKREADDTPDTLVESIRSMRESGDVPELFEGGTDAPANDRGGAESSPPDEPPPEISKLADGGTPDWDAIDKRRAANVTSLSDLSTMERRKRFAGNR